MRTRGQGRVFKRKGSPFWWISYYVHGEEQREVAHHSRTTEKLQATEDNRQQAERFRKRRIGEVIAEQHGGPAFVGPAQQRTTVNELLDALQKDYELRNKWSNRSASTFKAPRAKFGAWRATAVSSEAIAAWQLELREQKYADATINRFCQVLGQSFKLAIENKRLANAPVIKHLSEVGNERQGFFETADFGSVVSNLPDHLRDFCRFGFATGKRRGSIKSLRWSDVSDGIIYFGAKNVKARKAESVPIEGDVKEILERCRAKMVWKTKDGQSRFSEYVFHHEGRPIGDFRKAWAAACVVAGIGKYACPQCDGDVDAEHHCDNCSAVWTKEKLKFLGSRLFHDLRRTASRNMIRAGVPQSVAMRITGHRTDSMFRRYAITDEGQKREALERTQEYLRAAAEQQKQVTINTGRIQ